MWTDTPTAKKWRSDSLEARVYHAGVERARESGHDDPESQGMEAVFSVMHWLYSRPYFEVVNMILDEFQIETSQAALHRFWARFSSPWLAERMRRSSAAARELANSLDAEEVNRATWELISQQAFDLLSSPQPDPDSVVKIARLVLQARGHDLDERKVRVMEEKLEQAKLDIDNLVGAAKREGGLTPETLAEIEQRAALL